MYTQNIFLFILCALSCNNSVSMDNQVVRQKRPYCSPATKAAVNAYGVVLAGASFAVVATSDYFTTSQVLGVTVLLIGGTIVTGLQSKYQHSNTDRERIARNLQDSFDQKKLKKDFITRF